MSTPQSPESILFFLPVHNEADNIHSVGQATIAAFTEQELDFHLAIINDGSTDDSAVVAQELSSENPGLVSVISHTANRGYGGSLRTGLQTGLDSGRPLIGFMDGDGQFDPHDIGQLLESMRMSGSDVAIGDRQQRQDRIHRVALGKSWKLVSRLVLGCDVTDVDCGFKLFSRDAAAAITPNLISERGGAISPEIIVRGRAAGLRFSETPVRHLPRTHGESSGGDLSVILQSGRDLLKVRRSLALKRHDDVGVLI